MPRPILKGYGDTEGPLGFPMKSDQARELETLIKGLPKECRDIGLRHLSKAVDKFSLQEGERADVSYITTNSIDSDREIVLPGGLNWDRFKKSGMPVTFAHNYSALPVGRAQWVKRQKDGDVDGWLAKTVYASKPDGWSGDWFPDAVWSMVQSKILRGKSIGYMPTSLRGPTEKELQVPGQEGLRLVFEKAVVLEYAVAPIQSNPDAVLVEVAKCAKAGTPFSDIILEELGLVLPEDVPDIDPAFLKSATAEDQTPPSQKTADPSFVTLEDWKDGFKKSLAEKLKNLDLADMVQNVIDRRRGRV